MKIKYLGTAAAEAVPAPFCECNVCEYARKQGGKNIRTRSQALIDGKLLIDFPADTFMHTLNEKFKLSDISACIITHSHSDHLYPAELFCRESCAAHMKQEHPFVMIGTEDIIESIHADYPNSYLLEKEKFLELHPIVPFVPFEVEEYKITPLAADHSTKQPVIYIIEKDDKAILYAHDTGFFPDKTMEYLAKSSVCFDLISYDCTNGLLEWENRGHMGLIGNEVMRERLKDLGKLKEKTLHVVNHFSHNGLAGYDQLVPIAGEKNFIVSYDGLVLEF